VNTSSASQPLSGPVEDYLKAIYDLERGAQPATTNEIAERLAISPASVSGMVRRLADQGLITHEPYRGVRLTEDGRRAALRTLRRHRILECYLTEVLGYPWDRVHDEAEQLEHTASEELIERMASALGDPSHDPHGAPIPSREGEVDETTLRTLADAAVGEQVRVRQVMDKDAERLRYLAELGIRPGALVRILERAPFGGPITLGVGRSGGGVTRVIGPALAEQVLVEPFGAD
jgi:DtxR family Mn-dependent transcriptional regulator